MDNLWNGNEQIFVLVQTKKNIPYKKCTNGSSFHKIHIDVMVTRGDVIVSPGDVTKKSKNYFGTGNSEIERRPKGTKIILEKDKQTNRSDKQTG